MNQQGVTFLEIVVVIAILMITSALVAPSIQDWRQKRALESDFMAVLAQIDYLKLRARTLNGTATLNCQSTSGRGNVLTYQVSKNPQISISELAGGFVSNLVENPSEKSPAFNLISGKTTVVSDICNASSAIITAAGQVGVEGNGQTLIIELEPQAGKTIIGGFKIMVNPLTGFIQKYTWQLPAGRWAEID